MHFDCLKNPDNIQKDFVLLTAPWTDSHLPLMAPAALKPVIEEAGLSCLAVDLNVEVYNWTKNHPRRSDLVELFFNGTIPEDLFWEAEMLFIDIAKDILSFKPKFVGISMFSYACQESTTWICHFLKVVDPSITIIVGGAGAGDQFAGSRSWASEAIEKGLLDYHIRGDAEISLPELLKGNKKYPGVNSESWREMTNEELSALPLPDYDNYNFDNYELAAVGLIGSRGCVQRCKFCDIIENWKHFRWRSADNIFDEMMLQYTKYGIREFKFQDSLINGSMSQFRRLIELLSDWNTTNPDKSFRWSSYFMFRDKQHTSEDEWDLIAKSGARVLHVGIENLNNHIRTAMGKNFSDESIIYHFENAKKHGITIGMLNIIGYINETRKDIDYIKNWFTENKRFNDTLWVEIGGTLGIFPNTYLDRNKEELGITKIGEAPPLWISKHTDSTPEIRAKWAREIEIHCRDLGFQVADQVDNHYILEMLIKNGQQSQS